MAQRRASVEVVERQHDAPVAPPELGQAIEHAQLVAQVEVRDRLVEQHERRVLREQGRNGDALPLAAGERRHVAARQRCKADLDQRPIRMRRLVVPFPRPARQMRMTAQTTASRRS